MHSKRTIAILAAALVVFAVLPAEGFSLNKGIDIDAGAESGAQSTINGSISVGEEATVNGTLETVNGAIRIEEGARIEDARTVNGAIRIASGVSAEGVSSVNGSIDIEEDAEIGDVSVVNGKIGLQEGTTVRGDVGNVNGEIKINGAEIGGDLSTVSGDVSLSGDAILHGDLTVEKPNGFGWDFNRRKPRIVIGPGVKVDGELVLEREVELYISETAKVGGVSGVMGMEQAIRFSGDRP